MTICETRIVALSMMTLSITDLFATPSINDIQHTRHLVKQHSVLVGIMHYTDFILLNIVMLSGFMVSIVMLSVIVINVVLLVWLVSTYLEVSLHPSHNHQHQHQR